MPVGGARDAVVGSAGSRARTAPTGPDADLQPLVRLLGPVQALVADRPVAFPSPKARALFARLALEPGRTVSVGRLLEWLWGDDPPETATATLQAYVSRLRRILGEGADPAAAAPARGLRIRRQPPGYLLEAPDLAVDTELFSRLSAAAEEQLDPDPRAAVALSGRALRLVRGEPLSDVVDQLPSTGAAEVQRLAEQVLSTRERHVDALLRTDDAETALLHTIDLLSEHPLRERSQALHLLALYRCGRQAEAVTAYERFRRRLGDTLGIDPGPQLRRLHVRLLQQDADLELRPARTSVPTATGTGADAADGPADVSIGRDVPLRRLESALAAAEEGRGSVWLVTGEAGIGKTTLCQDVAARARRRGLATVWGRGQGPAGTHPYWLWTPVLRALPELSGHRDADLVAGTAPEAAAVPAASLPGHRAARHQHLAELLADQARRQRLLVVLEDLQEADPLSLELLGAVAEVAAGSSLVLVCTLRSPGPPATTALTRLLARLAGEDSHQIRLTGLPPEQARLLLSRRLRRPLDGDRVDAVAARADGNPFFLVELARLLDERPATASTDPAAGVPTTVVAVLRDRLAALSPLTRRLLEVSAVVGREAQLTLLEQVSGLPTTELDAALAEAVETGFVTEQLLPTPRVCFTHALVHEALYEQLRPVARARLHAAVGVELATGRHHTGVDELARHLLLGAEVAGPAAALPALLQASRRAAAQTALEHAERLLRQALALTTRLPAGVERDRWELAVQSRLGSTVAVREGWGSAEANRALSRAQHLALRTEPDEEMVAALYHRLSWLTVTGDLDGAAALGEVLLERSTAPGPAGQWFELLGRMSRGAVGWLRGDDDEAVAELVRADELAARQGRDLAEAFREHPRTSVLALLSSALAGAGRSAEAEDVSQRSLVLARQSAPAEAGGAVMFAALLAAGREDREVASRLADELAELARASGLDLHAHTADVVRSWATATSPSSTASQIRTALGTLRAAVEGYRATGARMTTPILLTLLAEAELARGHRDGADEAFRAAARAAERGVSRLWSERLRRLVHLLPPPG
ncbi:BTAD domain-containing putative transcriptional regulator [Desertihabitans brevis]|uniref:BTAD domain-containing putative transcriptional regulator n=1 Tax=Desertihabitans brevis TaxID=2268447 RepID=UPI00131438E8|nr:BTAD domain-containing putative transcriptional regulator [Desertihabitans brevis]